MHGHPPVTPAGRGRRILSARVQAQPVLYSETCPKRQKDRREKGKRKEKEKEMSDSGQHMVEAGGSENTGRNPDASSKEMETSPLSKRS